VPTWPPPCPLGRARQPSEGGQVDSDQPMMAVPPHAEATSQQVTVWYPTSFFSTLLALHEKDTSTFQRHVSMLFCRLLTIDGPWCRAQQGDVGVKVFCVAGSEGRRRIGFRVGLRTECIEIDLYVEEESDAVYPLDELVPLLMTPLLVAPLAAAVASAPEL
jgi:hypothetical protein